ncbi:unnamed protein product [Coregonus sp. 'balchen']|nr:unnamed protein product [Coregonus sp. 'balchen']
MIGICTGLSLQVIKNELAEIQQLIAKLNSTTHSYQCLNTYTAKQLQELKEEMGELDKFYNMQVVRGQEANKRLRRDLAQCQKGHHPTAPPPEPVHLPMRSSTALVLTTITFSFLSAFKKLFAAVISLSSCSLCVSCGKLSPRTVSYMSVTGPNTYSPTIYYIQLWLLGSRPQTWFWMVPQTASNVFSNLVRLYSSQSSLVVGVSIPGRDALYYNCYNKDAVCRFNITAKTVTPMALPKGDGFNSKFNFCHLDAFYGYTDMDLATDEWCLGNLHHL